MSKKSIEKIIFKSHFKFVAKTANLLYFTTFSNIYLVLLDNLNQCVFSCSAGIAVLGHNKKEKLSSQNAFKFLIFFKRYFDLYNIKNVKLFIRSKVTGHLFQLIKYFNTLEMNVLSIHKIMNIPHNGMKSRKLRRI